MLKVVIADDEARVCRLVQMLPDWDSLGMQVAGSAANGLEALELLESLRPDILITDIRMPGCDGLELIKRAKKLSPNLQIIIISGYAQFEYAQTAITYGVSGYLLKPIKKEALTAALERVGEQCRQRTDSMTEIEHLRIQSHVVLLDKFFEDLRQGRFNEEAWLRLSENAAQNSGIYQIIILKADSGSETSGGLPMPMIQKKIEDIFATTLQPLCGLALLHFQRAAGYGVLNFKRQLHDEMRNTLRGVLNQMQAQETLFGRINFSLSIGCEVDSPEKLPISMKDAQNALAERLVDGKNSLLELVPPVSGLRSQQILDKYSRAIDYAFDSLSAAEAEKALDELAHTVKQHENARGYELFELVLAAGRTLALRVKIEEKSEILSEFEEQCENCGTIAGLFDCLSRFQARQIEQMWQQRENEMIRPIRLAKQYVQQHFSEPITLEDVCAATGFSVSYFSTMFKKETGEGFSKYITRVRIEQAKALLQDTNLSVADICEQVGYSDLKHFNTIFKKITSLNPGQYRKLYG